MRGLRPRYEQHHQVKIDDDALDAAAKLSHRYVSAAEKISHLAVGSTQRVPGGDTIRVRPDITQEDRIEGFACRVET